MQKDSLISSADIRHTTLVSSLLSLEEGKKFFDEMRERVFFLKDLNITSRVFHLWKNSGLIDLPADVSSRKWIKFNFLDYIWLSLVKDMRSFGLPFEQIKKVKEEVLQNIAGLDKQVVNEETLKELSIQSMMDKLGSSREEAENIISDLIKSSNVDSFYKVIEKQMGRELTILESFLSLKGMCDVNSSLVIFIKNENENNHQEKDEDNQQNSDDNLSNIGFTFWSDLHEGHGEDPSIKKSLFNRSHIELPLSNYIENFILDKKHFSKIKQMEWLSPQEVRLIEELRKGNASEITIKFKEGKAEMIEVTQNVIGEVETKLLRSFAKGEYSVVSYNIADGKIQHFKKTIKHKI